MSKNLGDVLRELSHGPLSNLSIGSDGIGEIAHAEHDRVVSLVNQGLSRLHARFVISKKELTLRMIEDRLVYPLRLVHAESSGGTEDKFILDGGGEAFADDVIKVMRVYDKDDQELVINALSEPYALSTPKPNELRFAEVLDGETFRVVYQAGHSKLEGTDLEREIVLPEPLYEALECYVGHRVLRAMNGQEHRAQANDLMEMYEAICREIEEKDLNRDSWTSANTKLEYWGFV
jgi:hypothetical protein